LTGSTQFNGFQSGDFNAFQQSFALTRRRFGFIRPLLANGARQFWRKLAAMDLETKMEIGTVAGERIAAALSRSLISSARSVSNAKRGRKSPNNCATKKTALSRFRVCTNFIGAT
jgi:hypothetical protein